MRAVAGRLELVEHGGRILVAGRQLVDDEHLTVDARDTRHLGDDEVGPLDVMERAMRSCEVECAVREREGRPVALDELGVRERPSAGECEQLRHRIEPDDLPHEGRQGERERAGAAADVERALVPAWVDELAHLRCELRCTSVLTRRDPLGRAREPVSHGRCGGRGLSPR